MQKLLKTAVVLGVALSIGMVAAPQVFAKSHDQGVADGDRTPGGSNAGGAGDFVQSLGGSGLQDVVSGGTRGDAASAAKSDNNGDKGLGRSNGQGQN